MNPLQRIHQQTTKKLLDFAGDYSKKLIAGIPFSTKVWETETKRITLGGMLQAVGLGLLEKFKVKDPADVSNYYLQQQYFGKTLSSRLRASAEEARRLVDKVVNDHAKAKSNWKAITKELNQLGISKGDLPKYLTDLNKKASALLPDSKEYKKLLENAKRRALSLKNEALRNSYSKVIKAVESNSPAKLAESIRIATEKKAIYNNERIARTETAKAWNDAFMRRILDDKNINAVKYLLSSGHPITDLCDHFAEVDSYGLGGGIYPKERSPQIPVHCNCLCILDGVTLRDISKANFNEKLSRQQLDLLKIPKNQKKQILEGKANGNGLRGGNPNAHPLPRKFVEPVENPTK